MGCVGERLTYLRCKICEHSVNKGSSCTFSGRNKMFKGRIWKRCLQYSGSENWIAVYVYALRCLLRENLQNSLKFATVEVLLFHEYSRPQKSGEQQFFKTNGFHSQEKGVLVPYCWWCWNTQWSRSQIHWKKLTLPQLWVSRDFEKSGSRVRRRNCFLTSV